MSITQITTDITGEVGINPRLVRIVCTDTYAEVTAANYLLGAEHMGYSFLDTDFFAISYSGGRGWFKSTTADGVITLSLAASTGTFTDGHFANFDGTSGLIKDDGFLPTDATKTKVVMANAAVIANHIACFSDTSGTVDDDAATAFNGGNLQAGLSGTAGTLASFPATASKGSLKVVAVANTGDTVTTISNVAMGQATVVSIPDPATATANFAVAPAALVSNNLVKASGTAGLVADAGHRLIANTTATYAGGGTSNAYAATGLTVGAKGSAVIRASTNAVSICKAVPGTDTLTITFSADPGANTTVDYIYATAAAS